MVKIKKKYLSQGTVIAVFSFLLLFAVTFLTVFHKEENDLKVDKSILKEEMFYEENNKIDNFYILKKENEFYLPETKLDFDENIFMIAEDVATIPQKVEDEPVKAWNSQIEVFREEKNDFFLDYSLVADIPDTICVYDTKTEKNFEMSLEEYVVGCVLAEIPMSYCYEAIKAQAIACRTYSVYKLLGGTYHKSGASLCTSSAHCQGFVLNSGIAEEGYNMAKNAVDETKGIVMFYDKKPILSVFHSSDGKKTNSSAEVWGGDLYYLQSVETWESENPKMNTQKQYFFDKAYFLSKIMDCGVTFTNGTTQNSEISEIYVTKNPSGKTNTLSVNGASVKAETIVSAFGLRSGDFDVELISGNVVFTVYGYGHGVGMSQNGAEDLAQKGYLFNQILSHYYRGISFGIAV